MKPKRYAGNLTIQEALQISRQILRDNADNSHTLFGTLNINQQQALQRLGQVAASRDRADRKSAAKRKDTATLKRSNRGLTP